MDSCRDEILYEVDLIKRIGSPGRIIVFGRNAEAIITGKNEEDVILAAAQYGKGRLCVFSHGGYGKQLCDEKGNDQNAILYRNVRNWVTGKELSDNFKVLKLDDNTKPLQSLQELQKFDFLISCSGRETTSVKLVEDYIKAGGGFIYASTPWGWLQLNHGKKVYEMPYNKILLEAGITFSKGICEDHGPGFAIELNKASDANLERCILQGSRNVNAMIDKVNLIALSRELPPHLKDKLKNELGKEWKLINDKVAKTFPSGKIKTKNIAEKKLLDFWLLCAEMQENKHFKAYGIHSFPGDFDNLPKLSKETVKFTSMMEDYYLTSCYVPAGVPVRMSVKNVTHTWTAIVGAHTDFLAAPIVNRWPKLSYKTEIKSPGDYDISSPFGGSICFLSPRESSSTIEATIDSVVVCPRFELLGKGKPWKESRDDPGLWSDVCGKYLSITLPSSSIKKFENPGAALEMFDNLLMNYHDLRGTDINKIRKMWIVTDEQPSAGYMHAGYPIVTHMDVAIPENAGFLLNAKSFKEGAFWGIFHEMGHNMQQTEWTFSGAGEVTVNIFTLYGMYTMCGIDPWIHPWLKKQVDGGVKYLKSGAKFDDWKRNAGFALFVYAQLAHCFKWDAYKRVFRRYQVLKSGDKPKQDEDKIDLWFQIFSEETKFNLAPMAIFWGLPLSDKGLKKIESLKFTPFLPDDEITKAVPERVTLMKGKFAGLTQSLNI